MMNRQVEVEKIIGTIKCVATCGTIEIKPSKREIRRQTIRQTAPAAICS